MRYDEFVKAVQDRADYEDRAQAERRTQQVLVLLAQRLTAQEAKDVASQLPPELGSSFSQAGTTQESFGVEEFLERLDSAGLDSPRREAHAVLSTLAEAVTGGQLNQVLSQLPAGYAALFGKPELS